MYYSGNVRQRGRGFGAVALGLGRTLIPLAARGLKYALPIARKIGTDLVKQIAPELIESLVEKRKPRARNVRRAVGNTIKKQIGNGRKRKIIRSKVSAKKSRAKRSRSSFFSRVKNVN